MQVITGKEEGKLFPSFFSEKKSFVNFNSVYACNIVIVSNVSQSVYINHCNSLKSVFLREFPCVYKEKPSGVLVDSDNRNIHHFLHRLTL